MCLAFRNAGGFRIIWDIASISRNETASTGSSLEYLRWVTDKKKKSERICHSDLFTSFSVFWVS